MLINLKNIYLAINFISQIIVYYILKENIKIYIKGENGYIEFYLSFKNPFFSINIFNVRIIYRYYQIFSINLIENLYILIFFFYHNLIIFHFKYGINSIY